MFGSPPGFAFANLQFPQYKQYFYNAEDWGVEEAYKAYVNENSCDTVQVYFLAGPFEEPILLAQKET